MPRIRKSLWVRIVLTFLLVAGILYTVILSSLAGEGSGPFQHKKGFVGVASLETCLMPANYYHFIWVLLYLGLFFIGVYAIVMVAQRAVSGQGEGQCGALPLSVLVMLIISININTGWLFAEDNLNASWSFVVSLLLLISNCIALAYSTHSFSVSAKVLYRESVMDFWMSIVVLNGLAMYVAWSFVQFFKSFTVFLVHEVDKDMNKVCTGMHITMTVLIVLWFIAENTILSYLFNTVFMHYVVLLWYAATLYPRQAEQASNSMRGLLITCVVLLSVLLLLRLVILFRRNRGNKAYKTTTPAPSGPVMET